MTDMHVFTVADMTCDHCEKTLKAALAEALPGAPVVIDIEHHTVTVQGDAEVAEAAIAAAGYAVG